MSNVTIKELCLLIYWCKTKDLLIYLFNVEIKIHMKGALVHVAVICVALAVFSLTCEYFFCRIIIIVVVVVVLILLVFFIYKKRNGAREGMCILSLFILLSFFQRFEVTWAESSSEIFWSPFVHNLCCSSHNSWIAFALHAGDQCSIPGHDLSQVCSNKGPRPFPRGDN